MIVGHQKQWNFLKQAATLGLLSHAYLFAGPSKLGKKTIALKWLSLILNYPLEERRHPDLILIEPQNNVIQISQIRDLIWKLKLSPHSTSFKTAIIDQAHLMGIEAQNALLKTLEEPKGNVLLILITQFPENFLPTIISRCEILKFHLVPKAEIKGFLENQGLSTKEAEDLATISQGRPGIAIDFLLNPQKLESQKKIINKLIKISNSPLIIRFQYAKDLSQEKSLEEILEIWLSYLRKILLAKINKSPGFEGYSFAKLKNTLSVLERTRFLITTTNVNSKLALEILMLNF
ncbi:hypothetical protein AMJ50_01465 [Parcubacteria bacterium DG_74_3]|nr:MAG: hypothetical protein AMJ50_01465 [Parcubacteria bacterium DG_74_3]